MSGETKEIIYTASLDSYRKSTSATISGKDGTQRCEYCTYCGMPKAPVRLKELMPNRNQACSLAVVKLHYS